MFYTAQRQARRGGATEESNYVFEAPVYFCPLEGVGVGVSGARPFAEPLRGVGRVPDSHRPLKYHSPTPIAGRADRAVFLDLTAKADPDRHGAANIFVLPRGMRWPSGHSSLQ